MNRERILFLSVAAILALYALVLRSPPTVVREEKSRQIDVKAAGVAAVDRSEKTLQRKAVGPWTQVTNEKPHPRIRLGPVEEAGLPPMWPPTSLSLSVEGQSLLRRPAAKPVDGAPALELPMPAAAGGGGGAPGTGGAAATERGDSWTAFNKANRVKGTILGIVQQQGGARKIFRAARQRAMPPEVDPFDRLLCLLQIDPQRASIEGVTQIEAKLQLGGTLSPQFPEEIQNIEVALEGPDLGYYEGLKEYLKLPAQGYDSRLTAGRKLLEVGTQRGDKWLLRWAEAMLLEARAQVPPDVQATMRQILLLLVEVETRLNRQEKILELAFEHLSRFADEEGIWEYLGALMESRAFNLPQSAIRCYERASQSATAQRRRAALLVRIGRFDEAAEVLESRRAGSGASVDLLQARILLARGDLEGARGKARSHADGEMAAEALQVLGAVDYALGNAAEAEKSFLAACKADPLRSTAFSDLGLALAAQGKAADARACFARALDLDRLDNAVMPRIGEAWLRMNAGDKEGMESALEVLREIQESNPRELLSRYYSAYCHEALGRLDEAVAGLKQILDQDYRHRYTIAHLGAVQAKRALAGGDEEASREAVAYMKKAIALQPKEPLLPYILARFLMARDQMNGFAEELFLAAAKLPPPPNFPTLAFWAQAGAAAMVYRDDSRDPLRAVSSLNRVIEDVKALPEYRTTPQLAEKHPVYVYADAGRKWIQRTMKLVDREFVFQQKPTKDYWRVAAGDPMFVHFRGGRVEFAGTFKLGGELADVSRMAEKCALVYSDPGLQGGTISEVTFQGVCRHDSPGSGEIGVGLGRPDRTGPKGVLVKLDRRTKSPVIRLDGGIDQAWKQRKGKEWGVVAEGTWPEDGAFSITIKVDDPEKGLFTVTLNGAPVLQGEMCNSFTRSAQNQKLELYVWVEGLDGDPFGGIFLDKILLTMSK